MLFLKFLVCIAIILKIFTAAGEVRVPGGDIQTPTGYTLLRRGLKGSKLYSIDAASSIYDDAPLLLNLVKGSSYDQGFDNGYLMGKSYIENYNALMVSLFGDAWWEPAVADITSLFLKWQWDDFMSVQVPDEYIEELKGMSAGGKAAGILKPDVGELAGWGITLANLPGSLENLKYILLDEKNNPNAEFKKKLAEAGYTWEQVQNVVKKINWNGLTCSMFGVWGSRTDNNKLYTGRNLDWEKDTGMSKYKVITVHHPPSGTPHATFGYSGKFLDIFVT